MSAGIRITGTVVERASYGLNTATGQYLLTLMVADGTSDRPYMAERDFGQGPAASIACEQAAHQLKVGTAVVLHGSGLTDKRHQGGWVRRLMFCDLIEHHSAQPRHEPVAHCDVA